MKKDLLTKPFRPDQVKQRKGNYGQALSYVSTADVIARLNECFDFQWSLDVLHHSVEHGEAVVLVRLTADGVTKCAFGGAAITLDREGDPLSFGDSFKSACADGLKKASSLFGIGLELYGGSKDRPRESDSAPSASPRPRPLMPQERVTSRQLAALHSAARRTGLEKGDLETFLEERVGHSGLNELSRTEASRLISELSGNGGDQRA